MSLCGLKNRGKTDCKCLQGRSFSCQGHSLRRVNCWNDIVHASARTDVITNPNGSNAAFGGPYQIAVSGHDQYVAWKQAGTGHPGAFRGFLCEVESATAA
jgi:hypothetical protein